MEFAGICFVISNVFTAISNDAVQAYKRKLEYQTDTRGIRVDTRGRDIEFSMSIINCKSPLFVRSLRKHYKVFAVS